jgi:hypothetical protein
MCDAPEAFSERTRKARKLHQCVECRGRIQPGQAYQYCSGIWDGEARSFKTCIDCAKDRAEFDAWVSKEDPWNDCASAFGELREMMREYQFVPPWRDTEGLSVETAAEAAPCS